MRRRKALEAVYQLIRIIRNSNPKKGVEQTLNQNDASPAIRALHTLTEQKENLKEEGKCTLEIMGPEFDIFDRNFWEDLIKNPENPALADEKVKKIEDTIRVLEIVKELLDFETPSEPEGADTLTVILASGQDKARTVSEVEKALAGVRGLYGIYNELHDLPDRDPTLLSADTGTEISFEISGIAQAIGWVRETVAMIWNQLLMSDIQRSKATIETIKEGLPAFKRINNMEENEEISRERAEKLRRSVTSSITKITESRAVTEKLQERTGESAEELTSGSRKLLEETTQTSEEEES